MAQDISTIANFLIPQMSKYCPHEPFAKQLAFMSLTQEEALYGGALGGGKSDCALMEALRFVHIPGYSALLLRRSLTDLKLAGALLDRMQEWMLPYTARKEVTYKASEHTFYFPTYDRKGTRQPDAKIIFGYIGNSNARVRYQGIELNFCLFDELTQHIEKDYEYLFTRLRKCTCPIHKTDSSGNPIYIRGCELCENASQVPTKMRGTCNPDGIGFAWVKKRFDIKPHITDEESRKTGEKQRWLGGNKNRPFIPASFYDNPYIDHKNYEKRLRSQLSDDLYEALVEGSWGVSAHSRFKKRWKRSYSFMNDQGTQIRLSPNPQSTAPIIDTRRDIQTVFMTMDPASTSEKGPGDVDMYPTKVKNPSYTVICAWMLTTCTNLLLMDMLRFREEIPDVVDEFDKMYRKWCPEYAVVEENGLGKGVVQYAADRGINIKGVFTTKDKLENATEAIMAMKRGRIWLPVHANWLEECEGELWTWQGHPQETDDVIDNFSNASNHVNWDNADEAVDYIDNVTITTQGLIPTAVKPLNMFTPGTVVKKFPNY